MKFFFFTLMMVVQLSTFSQTTINLPVDLKFGISEKEFQSNMEAHSYSGYSQNPFALNQYEDFKAVYAITGFAYTQCKQIGTIKPAIFSGFFTKNKLSVVRLSFSVNNNYHELMEVLENKYGKPDTVFRSDFKIGGINKVAIWQHGKIAIRLYANAFEPMEMPFLEYVDLDLLKEAKKDKDLANKNAF